MNPIPLAAAGEPLGPPPPLAPGAVRVLALGGLGEVGRNMTVIEFGAKILIIDCGVLFPEEHQPGVDLILPDLEYIRQRADDVVGLVLTHGHEDHIGAVPYLLRIRGDIPIYGSKLTVAFLLAKLKEFRINPISQVVREGEHLPLAPFDCEFIAVNHSIPDALAVGVRVGGHLLLHTGDFKMDQLPLDGRITDLRAFARLGEEGVDLFMPDSTNAEVPGFTTSEVEIGPVLDRVFAGAKGRIVVASFASHVHRVQQVLDAAAAHGRRVAFVGRSMVRNMGIAADLGHLNVPPGILVDARSSDDIADDKIVYMATGSQGEPMAALARMSSGDHKVKVSPGDVVVFASSLIPGNENAVYRVINGMARMGATVVHQGNAKVHVSGHASAGELLYCYNIIEPRNVMPIHGEVRHLIANAGLAVRTGVAPERVMLAENGVVVDIVDHKAHIAGVVPVGFVYVDGSSVGSVTDAELKDRRILGEEGFVSIFVVVDSSTGKVSLPPEIHARGFAEGSEVFDEVIQQVVVAVEDAMPGAPTTFQLQQVVRRTVGKWVSSHLRRRPMIIPVVVEA